MQSERYSYNNIREQRCYANLQLSSLHLHRTNWLLDFRMEHALKNRKRPLERQQSVYLAQRSLCHAQYNECADLFELVCAPRPLPSFFFARSFFFSDLAGLCVWNWALQVHLGNNVFCITVWRWIEQEIDMKEDNRVTARIIVCVGKNLLKQCVRSVYLSDVNTQKDIINFFGTTCLA